MKPDPQRAIFPASPSGEYRIDQLCTEFESAWKSGRRERIEDWLPRVSESDRAGLLRELILVEVELRRAAGEPAERGDYQQRFPDRSGVVDDAFQLIDERLDRWDAPTVVDNQPLPAAIGRYPVVGVLGEGSFGRVYLAHDPRLGRNVAIKVAMASQFKTAGGRERFLLEARNAAQLDHPGIIRIYDVDETNEALYIVQQFVEGRNLADCAKEERWSVERIAGCMNDVARALAYAHKRGLVHCDLKPANILVKRDGHPLLVDFGLSVDEITQRDRQGEISGSPRYMSPEQTRGQMNHLDGRSDIWSLGVILYELVTGRPPFSGETRDEVYDEILNREPKPPRMIDEKVPAELERIILRCLSKPVAGRYSTALEVARDLQKLGRRSRHWWWAAAAGILALVLGIVWRPFAPPAGTSPPTSLIESFRVVQFRDHAKTSEPVGEIGVDSPAAREDDLVQVVARFREPLYCYLIAFNPDGSEQICPRGSEDTKPQRLAKLEYPVFPKAYRLTDGTGQQAFAIVASRDPLPKYREWRERNGPAPWEHFEAGSVIRFDGQVAGVTFPGKKQGSERGQEADLKGVKPFEQLCRFLTERSPADGIQAVTFPVLAKPEP